MGGEFNIAVAEIQVFDENGRRSRGEDGKAIADFILNRLSNYFEDANISDIQVEFRGQDEIPSIKGNTPEERLQSAEAIAEKINAHILVFGNISGEAPLLTQEFYVNMAGFDQADEIIGPYQLGSSMSMILPFDASRLQSVENPAFSARVNALSLITLGLVHYANDQYDQALDYFERAVATPGWISNAGKEVAHLLIGNTYSRLASTTKSPTYLDEAESSYLNALQINPAYSRAKGSLAGVIYLKALGDVDNLDPANIDVDLLNQAENQLLDLLVSGSFSTEPWLEAKIHFYLGQIYLVRSSLYPNQDWSNKARQEFDQVIQAFEMGETRLKDTAAHAFAHSGLLDRIEGNYPTAEGAGVLQRWYGWGRDQHLLTPN